MSIDEIYKISKSIGKRILLNRKPISLSHRDIAHDVYIKCYEGGGFLREKVVKLISAAYSEQINISMGHHGIDVFKPVIESIEKVCTKCGENKNINEFTLQKEKFYQRYSSLCNKCRIKKIIEWQKRNPTKQIKRKQKQYQNKKKDYQQRNVEARNTLSDWYVKRSLVLCGNLPHEITPEMIIEKREKLLRLRIKRAIKDGVSTF